MKRSSSRRNWARFKNGQQNLLVWMCISGVGFQTCSNNLVLRIYQFKVLILDTGPLRKDLKIEFGPLNCYRNPSVISQGKFQVILFLELTIEIVAKKLIQDQLM